MVYTKGRDGNPPENNGTDGQNKPGSGYRKKFAFERGGEGNPFSDMVYNYTQRGAEHKKAAFGADGNPRRDALVKALKDGAKDLGLKTDEATMANMTTVLDDLFVSGTKNEEARTPVKPGANFRKVDMSIQQAVFTGYEKMGLVIDQFNPDDRKKVNKVREVTARLYEVYGMTVPQRGVVMGGK